MYYNEASGYIRKETDAAEVASLEEALTHPEFDRLRAAGLTPRVVEISRWEFHYGKRAAIILTGVAGEAVVMDDTGQPVRMTYVGSHPAHWAPAWRIGRGQGRYHWRSDESEPGNGDLRTIVSEILELHAGRRHQSERAAPGFRPA